MNELVAWPLTGSLFNLQQQCKHTGTDNVNQSRQCYIFSHTLFLMLTNHNITHATIVSIRKKKQCMHSRESHEQEMQINIQILYKKICINYLSLYSQNITSATIKLFCQFIQKTLHQELLNYFVTIKRKCLHSASSE